MKSIGIFTTQTNEQIIHCIKTLIDLFPNEYKFFLYAPMFDEVKNDDFISKHIKPFQLIEGLQSPCFIISIGGDGTFLRASHLVAKSGIPLVGINYGRMGFLADIPEEELHEFVSKFINKQYKIEERSYIEISNPDSFGDKNYALNEISVYRKESSHLMTINTWIDDEFLGSFWADGIVVATPTGSTAYSLSLGGPIITPDSRNIIINAIAPHSLTVRPLVIPDTSVIKLQIEGRDNTYNISLDSKTCTCKPTDEIIIRKSKHTLKTIKIEGKSYFSTLRNKLMWGVDIRN